MKQHTINSRIYGVKLQQTNVKIYIYIGKPMICTFTNWNVEIYWPFKLLFYAEMKSQSCFKWFFFFKLSK